MKKLFYLSVIICSLVFSGVSIAEEVVSMDEVVVTATKTKELRKDVPNSVILIDDLDINESQANFKDYILNY